MTTKTLDRKADPGWNPLAESTSDVGCEAGGLSTATPLLSQLNAFWTLLKLQLANTRVPAIWLLVGGMFYPMILLFLFSMVIAPGDKDLLFHLLAGCIVVTFVLSIVMKSALYLAHLRDTGAMDYFATLPINQSALIWSLALCFLLQALPSAILLAAGASYLLDLPLAPHPLLLLVVPLAGLAMAAIGTLIGSFGHFLTARVVSQIATGVMISLSPVFVPLERFPELLRIPSYVLPSTYAASAIRDSLIGEVDSQTWLSAGILAVMSLALLKLVERFLSRQQQ